MNGTKTAKCELPLRGAASSPVKQRLPELFVHRRPTERQPKLRARISAGFNKLEILAICSVPRSERKRTDQRSMTRAFVIVGKAIALVTDLRGRLFEMEEMHRVGFC